MSEPCGSQKASCKVSRMVEAAGVERERSAFSKLVMARDFWS
jgi:hypothetical protein